VKGHFITILAVALSLAAQAQSNKITGTWILNDSINDFSLKLEFKADSSFSQTYTTKEIQQSVAKGSIQQDKYYLKNDSTLVMINPAGSTKEVHIKFIGDNRMGYFKNKTELDSANIFKRQ
jgi:hypothetical protein